MGQPTGVGWEDIVMKVVAGTAKHVQIKTDYFRDVLEDETRRVTLVTLEFTPQFDDGSVGLIEIELFIQPSPKVADGDVVVVAGEFGKWQAYHNRSKNISGRWPKWPILLRVCLGLLALIVPLALWNAWAGLLALPVLMFLYRPLMFEVMSRRALRLALTTDPATMNIDAESKKEQVARYVKRQKLEEAILGVEFPYGCPGCGTTGRRITVCLLSDPNTSTEVYCHRCHQMYHVTKRGKGFDGYYWSERHSDGSTSLWIVTDCEHCGGKLSKYSLQTEGDELGGCRSSVCSSSAGKTTKL